MGSTQSYITLEFSLTAAFLAGALATAYFSYLQPRQPQPGPTKGNGRKRKQQLTADADQSPPKISNVGPAVVAFPKVIPGTFDSPPDSAGSPDEQSQPPKSSKASKKKKRKAADHVVATNPPAIVNQPQGGLPPATITEIRPKKQTPLLSEDVLDDSWTRVESRHGGTAKHNRATDSVDATTTNSEVTGPSSVVEYTDDDFAVSANQRDTSSSKETVRTLAEKLVPKPRKTKVDDMVEEPSDHGLARVIRVQPRVGEKPAEGFSWGDYEDVDASGEDDGWGVVKSRGQAKIRHSPSIAAVSQPSPPLKGPETLTKRQRQNAARRETEKAVKADAEKTRLSVLAEHKRMVERERMKEAVRRNGKTVSGGMKAVVDEKGKLVWE